MSNIFTMAISLSSYLVLAATIVIRCSGELNTTMEANINAVPIQNEPEVTKAPNSHLLSNEDLTNITAVPIQNGPEVTEAPDSHFWSYEEGTENVDYSPAKDMPCQLRPTDPHIYQKLTNTLSQQVKLIEIRLVIANHSINPLLKDTKWVYQGDVWARVVHSHGITIISLTFNYGILSLMTLTFGVNSLEVELAEEPFGCLSSMTERARTRPVLDILLRDLDPDGPLNVNAGEGVCHQIIKNVSGYAKFADQCCFHMPDTGKIECPTDIPNVWLTVLNTILAIFVVLVFLSGPLAATSSLYVMSLEVEKYNVKLEKPLYKTLCICHAPINKDISATTIIDMTKTEGFKKCEEAIQGLPFDMVIPVKVDESHILVNYNKLLPENKVPVGMFRSLYSAIFQCHLHDSYPLKQCCNANSRVCIKGSKPLPWISVCRVIGRILLVFCILIPFYVRLVLYFLFEHPEVQARSNAADEIGLPLWFNYKMLQYLTPIHPLFIVIYVLYFCTGLAIACLSALKKKSRFQQVIHDSMRDLFDLNYFDAFGLVTKNFVWPFTKFGIWGILVGIAYWPIVMPLTIAFCLLYCTPILYLSGCMLHHALELSGKSKNNGKPVPVASDIEVDMHEFETDQILDKILSSEARHSCFGRYKKIAANVSTKKLVINISLAFLCICTLFSIMMLFAECASFVLRMCVFTLMGVIINAGQVLKYGMLIALVVIHSYDCYNNVYKKYLKFNKSLFSEIKGRISDLDLITNLPSNLQTHMGFKVRESEQQERYERKDDISQEMNPMWMINDLVLFVDSDDNPRIPRKLFEMTCGIKVSGSPGPVYRSLMNATRRFLIILFFLIFVFIVVLSFGSLYQVSNTNQILATMAGGFVPFIFSNFLKPSAPGLELGTVSFRSKLEEKIINYYQKWPMSDFTFQVEDNPDTSYQSSRHDPKIPVDDIGSLAIIENNPDLGKVESCAKLKNIKSVRSAIGESVDICVVVPNQEKGGEMSNEGLPLTSKDILVV